MRAGFVAGVHEGKHKEGAVAALIEIGEGAEVTVAPMIERFIKAGCQHRTGQGACFTTRLPSSRWRKSVDRLLPLVDVLNGPDWDMRVCAAAVLAEIGPAARGAVPSLIRAIEHPDPVHDAEILNRHAVYALGRIGPEAKAAIRVLNGLLDRANGNDFEVMVRSTQWALRQRESWWTRFSAMRIRMWLINWGGLVEKPARLYPRCVAL